ncbi:MAG: N-acetylglucosamine-6-phosphate deacetylase [Prochlorococcus sp.]|nr:N-acetylglucosamine-6-phosphate deacetylase [Prochlorococcaceae cyanobacterium Fu_MAG_50]
MRRITHIRLPQPLHKAPVADLWWIGLDDQARLIEVQPMPAGMAMAGESWHGDWLSPMGVDLQINGGLGLAFPELTTADLPLLLKLLDRLWADGVEAISPTLVTCGVPSLRQALEVLRQARAKHAPQRCSLLGAHLEGPFLAPERRGAHPLEHICAASLEALAERIQGFEHEIALITLAPEQPGADLLIERLRSLGVLVCLGHSAADAAQAGEAFDQGISMLTHTFNAMAGLHHRAPGPVGEACRRGGIALGLIADGVHVDPSMAVLLQRMAPDQLVLVSDALAPYGLEDGEHRWDARLLSVKAGTCRLADGTLAGVTLPLLEGCRKLARWSGEPGAAIWAATMAPRLALNNNHPLEQLLQGQRLTNLLRWKGDLNGDELSWQRGA